MQESTGLNLDEVLGIKDHENVLGKLITAKLISKSDTKSIWEVTSAGVDITVSVPSYDYYPNQELPEIGARRVGILNIDASGARLVFNSLDTIKFLIDGACPEVRDGRIRVMRIAREPGVRSKIAVAATVPGLDPVTSCVGRGASRIRMLSKYLPGEKIEMIAWSKSPEVFVRNALAPAEVSSVLVKDNEIVISIPQHQMSAAVGYMGLNVKLAGHLVGVPLVLRPDSKHV